MRIFIFPVVLTAIRRAACQVHSPTFNRLRRHPQCAGCGYVRAYVRLSRGPDGRARLRTSER